MIKALFDAGFVILPPFVEYTVLFYKSSFNIMAPELLSEIHDVLLSEIDNFCFELPVLGL